MACAYGHDGTVHYSAVFDALLHRHVENLGGNGGAGGDGCAVAGFVGFGNETGKSGLYLLDYVEWDFAEVAVKVEPLAAVLCAEDFFEGQDFEPNGGRVVCIEDGDGLDEAVKVAEELVNVSERAHLAQVVEVGGFRLES